MKFIDNESKDDIEMLKVIFGGLGGFLLGYIFILLAKLFV